MGWWASAVALQGEAANHREVRRSRAVVGVLFFFFGASPAGVLVAAGLWSAAGLLLGCLPLTDPHRGEQPSRW